MINIDVMNIKITDPYLVLLIFIVQTSSSNNMGRKIHSKREPINPSAKQPKYSMLTPFEKDGPSPTT